MADTKALHEHYAALSDKKLLKLAAEGGFTEEALPVLDKELARRNLSFDKAKRQFAPDWLDQAVVGTIGLLTIENGEQITAQVVGLNEEGDRLSVQIIPSEGFSRKGLRTRRSHRYIPLNGIAAFEPQPHLMEQWPFSDPCRQKSSRPHILLMSAIFLSMTVGSEFLVVLLRGKTYGPQVASFVSTPFSYCSLRLQRPAAEAAVIPQVTNSLVQRSNLRFRVCFGVISPASLCCSSLKGQCQRHTPTCPTGGMFRKRKDRRLSRSFYCSSASVWQSPKSSRTSPCSTEHTGNSLRDS